MKTMSNWKERFDEEFTHIFAGERELMGEVPLKDIKAFISKERQIVKGEIIKELQYKFSKPNPEYELEWIAKPDEVISHLEEL